MWGGGGTIERVTVRVNKMEREMISSRSMGGRVNRNYGCQGPVGHPRLGHLTGGPNYINSYTNPKTNILLLLSELSHFSVYQLLEE